MIFDNKSETSDSSMNVRSDFFDECESDHEMDDEDENKNDKEDEESINEYNDRDRKDKGNISSYLFETKSNSTSDNDSASIQ